MARNPDSPVSEAQRAQRRAAGRARAVQMYGAEPRIVRLDDLNPAGRRLVLALIAAAKAEAETRADADRTAAGTAPRTR